MEIIEDPLQLIQITIQHIDSMITGIEQRMELYPNPDIHKNAEGEIERLQSAKKKYFDAAVRLSVIQREREVDEFVSAAKTQSDAAIYSV